MVNVTSRYRSRIGIELLSLTICESYRILGEGMKCDNKKLRKNVVEKLCDCDSVEL